MAGDRSRVRSAVPDSTSPVRTPSNDSQSRVVLRVHSALREKGLRAFQKRSRQRRFAHGGRHPDSALVLTVRKIWPEIPGSRDKTATLARWAGEGFPAR